VGKDRRLGNLATPTNVQRLQTALHAKAKEEPEFRFHALYDKIYRIDILEFAYACCRANKGAPGIDGVTFEGVENAAPHHSLAAFAYCLSSLSLAADGRCHLGKSRMRESRLSGSVEGVVSNHDPTPTIVESCLIQGWMGPASTGRVAIRGRNIFFYSESVADRAAKLLSTC
jgi:hypothetical protein